MNIGRRILASDGKTLLSSSGARKVGTLANCCCDTPTCTACSDEYTSTSTAATSSPTDGTRGSVSFDLVPLSDTTKDCILQALIAEWEALTVGWQPPSAESGSFYRSQAISLTACGKTFTNVTVNFYCVSGTWLATFEATESTGLFDVEVSMAAVSFPENSGNCCSMTITSVGSDWRCFFEELDGENTEGSVTFNVTAGPC